MASDLKDINIPEASSCEVSLLIGSDCMDIILPIETRCGPGGSPVGTPKEIILYSMSRKEIQHTQEDSSLVSLRRCLIPLACWRHL